MYHPRSLKSTFERLLFFHRLVIIEIDLSSQTICTKPWILPMGNRPNSLLQENHCHILLLFTIGAEYNWIRHESIKFQAYVCLGFCLAVKGIISCRTGHLHPVWQKYKNVSNCFLLLWVHTAETVGRLANHVEIKDCSDFCAQPTSPVPTIFESCRPCSLL